MGTQERAAREINLADLFWEILLSWRKCVCLGILFAIVLSGMKYFMDVRSFHASQNIDVEKEKSNLEQEEIEQLSDAVALQRRVDAYEKYQEKSALMRLDPYAKPVLELQFYIQSDYIINYTSDHERDYTPELVAMYCNYVNSGEMAQKVIADASLSVSAEDFRELLSVSSSGSTVSVSISYAESAKLTEISNVVKTFLGEKEPELQEVGSHKLELIDESQSIVVDTALAEKKNTIADNIATLEYQLKNMKNSMSDKQTALFDIEVSEMRGEELEEEEEPGFSVLFVILGGMLGIILVCIWIACKIIFASKLQSSEEIGSVYGMRLLGRIEISVSSKKHFLQGVDNWILKIKNCGKKRLSMEQQIEVIAANVVLSCKKQELECIYMTGSEYEKVDKVVLDKLKQKLSGQEIKVKDGGNILYDASSLQSGVENGHIILVEQKNVSVYDELSAELDLLEQYDIEVLGVIVLE